MHIHLLVLLDETIQGLHCHTGFIHKIEGLSIEDLDVYGFDVVFLVEGDHILPLDAVADHVLF